MADCITRIRTDKGDLPIDYNALEHKPKSDDTLSNAGAFADAKETGDRIKDINSTISELTSEIEKKASKTIMINGHELSGNFDLTAKDVGAISGDGGSLNDNLIFANTDKDHGLQWVTSNDTIFMVKSDIQNNVLQITMTPDGGDEETILTIAADGNIVLKKPLAVSDGGTGAKDTAAARESLEITPENIGAASAEHTHGYSDIEHSHSANDITSGALAVERGGTWNPDDNTIGLNNLLKAGSTVLSSFQYGEELPTENLSIGQIFFKITPSST